MATPVPECTLDNPHCYRQCKGCGWNVFEIQYRKKLLKRFGLKRDKDGLRCIIRPKEDKQ